MTPVVTEVVTPVVTEGMTPLRTWPAAVPVLIPVYNHVGTVGQVIAGCRALGAQMIVVVDDGSSDGSGDAARSAGADQVLTMPRNQGKGAALRMGLAHCSAAGHSQVLTIDADMQHPPEEGFRLAVAAASQPEALWLGVREMTGAPRASRFGRWWTNIWTWVTCGVWPQDNQTGLRVYPLPIMHRLHVGAGGYAFEIESLVRAVWKGVPVRMVLVAVRYPADRISHFRVWADSWRTARAFTRLIGRRLVPWPEEGWAGWKTACTSGLSPKRLAAAAALGAAIGVAPIPGLQLGCAVWLAMVLRVNLGVSLLTSNISFGPLLAAWFALEVVVGHWLRTAQFPDLGAIQSAIEQQGAWASLTPWIGDWLLGSVPVMAACALSVGGATWLVAGWWRARA